MNAFINDLSTFLPGQAVDNNSIDKYLGRVDRVSARTRKMILASNGIEKRYYAIHPETGVATHTNAQLAAEAVRGLRLWQESPAHFFDCLCCGTSSPDQIMPGHASMVQGELGIGPCEIVSTAGICLTGISALKYAAMAIALGQSHRAVATGVRAGIIFYACRFFSGCGR